MQEDVVEMKETEIGDIPQGWDVSKIIEVCDTTAGGTPSRKKPEYFEGEIPWFKSGELNDGLIDYSEEKISELAIDESSAKLFCKGTLLIAMYGATAGKTAKLGIDAATNQAICAIFPDEAKLNSDFLQYNLIYSRNELLKNRHGGAQPNLNQGMIKNHPIPLPSLHEQQKIASILTTLQDAIEQTEAVIQATRELKKSMMKHLFIYGPVPVDQTDQVELKETKIGLVPKSWEVTKLDDSVKVKGGKRLPKGKDLVDRITDHPYLRVRDFKDGSIDKTDLKYITDDVFEKISKYTITKDNVFISIAGTIGLIGSIPSEMDGANLTENAAKIMINDNETLDKNYLKYYLSSQTAQHQIDIRTTKTSQPKLALMRIRQLPILLPPIKIQVVISEILSSIESKITIEIDKKKSLEKLFNSLLENLMTAKIRVI